MQTERGLTILGRMPDLYFTEQNLFWSRYIYLPYLPIFLPGVLSDRWAYLACLPRGLERSPWEGLERFRQRDCTNDIRRTLLKSARR